MLENRSLCFPGVFLAQMTFHDKYQVGIFGCVGIFPFCFAFNKSVWQQAKIKQWKRAKVFYPASQCLQAMPATIPFNNILCLIVRNKRLKSLFGKSGWDIKDKMNVLGGEEGEEKRKATVKQPAADTICSEKAGPANSIKNIWANCHPQTLSVFLYCAEALWVFLVFFFFNTQACAKGKQAKLDHTAQGISFYHLSIQKHVMIMFTGGLPVYRGIRNSRLLGAREPCTLSILFLLT